MELKLKSGKDSGKLNSKQKKQNRFLTKKGINLAANNDARDKNKMIMLGSAAIAVILLVVVKFGFIDQYARLNAAADDYDYVHSVYLDMQDAVDRYDEVQIEYRTYSMKWIYEDETGHYVTVNRQEILDLLEGELMKWGTVLRFSVTDMTMEAEMTGMNLANISQMLIALEDYPIVSHVSLGKTTSETYTGDLSFSLIIELQAESAESEEVAQ